MSQIPLLDLKAQFAPLREEIYAAIRDVIEAQAFVLGPTVEAFEADLAAYTGARHAIGCASGTTRSRYVSPTPTAPGSPCRTSPLWAAKGSFAGLGARG